MEQQTAINAIKQELERARRLFPEGFKNEHEAIAVIREEYIELEREVFKQPVSRDRHQMREEAAQLGAMALRFLMECL